MAVAKPIEPAIRNTHHNDFAPGFKPHHSRAVQCTNFRIYRNLRFQIFPVS